MAHSSIAFLLCKLSFPATAGMLIYSLFSLADTYFVARLGALSLAALTFSIPIQVCLVSIASATGVGLTSLIARTLGTGNLKQADNIAWHGVLICMIYGLLAILAARLYLNDLLILFGCTPELFHAIKDYLQIILYGSVFIFIPIMLTSVIQGEGNTFLPMIIALTGILINVALDPLLIFGYGPVKGMGLNGSALATVLAQMICSLQVIIAVNTNRNYMNWRLQHFRLELAVVYDIFKVSFPTIIMEMAGVFVMTVLNKVLAGYGNNAVAALGIFLRSRSFLFMPVYGLTQGTMPIAGFAYGSGNLDRVKEVFLKTSVLAALFTITAFIVMQYNSQWIMSIFSRDEVLTTLGIACMRLGTIFMPLMGPIIILYTVLQAIGKGATAMWFSLIRNLGFFYPLIIILPQYFGLNGVWLAFSLSELLAFILSVFFFIWLWRELQEKNKLKFIMLFNLNYSLKRTLAWLKFQ
ncbi:MAG: MATE family efflux transporter [Syntrophomonadaceae bacterium]|nr:MATE family efflux transporter [Syntrophomonadaceae bacterium]